MKQLIESHIRILECNCDSFFLDGTTTNATNVHVRDDDTINPTTSFQLVLHISPPPPPPMTTNMIPHDTHHHHHVIQEAIANGTWYITTNVSHHHCHPESTIKDHPLEIIHISSENDIDDHEDEDMKDMPLHPSQQQQQQRLGKMEPHPEIATKQTSTSGIATSTSTINNKHNTNRNTKKGRTIRPIYSYTEDHYIGMHIQCSMLK
jgi:hypothetical protein